MIEELSELSPQELLECFSQAIEYQNLQDALHYRIVRDFQGVGYKPFTPNPKQLEFFSTGLDAVERALMAANRFGKSLCAALETSAHLTLNYPDWWPGYVYDKPIIAWAAGVDMKSTNLSLKRYYLGDQNGPGLIHPSLIVDKNLKENTYYILNKNGHVSTLTFKSHDQGADTFQAASPNIIHMDEQYPYAIHSECVTRITKVSEDFHGQIIATFSPIKGTTLLTMHYTQHENPETEEVRNTASGEVHNSIVYINATHDDALHISEEEKQRLLLSYLPHEREARTKGIPSLGSGLIYPVHESEFVVSPFSIPDYWPRFYGLDFGWDHPTAAAFMAHDQDNDVIYVYAEYSASQLTPQDHSYQLLKQGADWMPGAYDYSGNAICPTDGRSLVELYNNSGLRSLYPANKSSVSNGVFTIRQRMETGKFKIFSNLTKLLTEIRMYSRDDNGKVKKGNDDLLDAMRYGIVSGLPIARVKPSALNKLKIPVHGSSGGSWMRV